MSDGAANKEFSDAVRAILSTHPNVCIVAEHFLSPDGSVSFVSLSFDLTSVNCLTPVLPCLVSDREDSDQ